MSSQNRYTIEEMERWSNDPRTVALNAAKYRYVQDVVNLRAKLGRLLKTIDEGLTEADVELAIKTVEQGREAYQKEREAASVLRGEKAVAIRDVEAAKALVVVAERTCNVFRLWLEEIGREAGLNNKPSYSHSKTLAAIAEYRISANVLNRRERDIIKSENPETTPLCGDHAQVWYTQRNTIETRSGCVACDAQNQLAEMAASRDRAIAVSNVDLDKRREVEETLATVNRNIQWLNKEYEVLETNAKRLTELNAAWNRVVLLLGLDREYYDEPEACVLALMVRERELKRKLENAESIAAAATANSGIIIKAYNARLARLALLEEMARLVTPGHGQRQQSCRLCKIVVELSALDKPTTDPPITSLPVAEGDGR